MNFATLLVDNNKSQHRFLKSEHGFSLYLSYNGKNILFDFGASSIVKDNIQTLDIDLKNVDCLVSSHSHYDHINGLRTLAPELRNKTLYVGSNFDLKKYGRVKDNEKVLDYLGANFEKDYLDGFDIKKTVVHDKLKISENIYIVSNFSCEKDNSLFHRFVIEDGQQFKDDYFLDELCLVIEREKDLVLIVGCSHPGILNIIKRVNSLFVKKVSTIIGGTHLSKADDEKIDSISNSLINLNIKDYYLCHCSGDKIIEKLKNNIQKCYSIGVGSTILL